MGPILIFDKSFLQSLNADESLWLDTFFLNNITPLFFIETLADLEKELRRGKTPEQVVGELAYKTPDMSSKCNTYHIDILYGELIHGEKLDIRGVPIISYGKKVQLGDEKGVFFEESPEEIAFQRWKDGKFLELERSMAKTWRKNLSNLNLEEIYETFQTFFPLGKPKEFKDVLVFVNFYINGPDQNIALRFGLSMVGIPERFHETIVNRWIKSGKLSIKTFAPYFYHVFSVDLFFNLSIASDLIARTRKSNKVDIAYLYYLPFCMVFVSDDHLHSKVIPLFMNGNQSYVLGRDLKADLSKLDSYYNELPEETKKLGIMSFAHKPPIDKQFLVSELWDKHMSKIWRANENQIGSDISKEILEKLKNFDDRVIQLPEELLAHTINPDFITLKRMVTPYKGKWQRFSQEVMDVGKDKEN